jgi:hypothetical protein
MRQEGMKERGNEGTKGMKERAKEGVIPKE